MRLNKTPAEKYWEEHGGEAWKYKMDKRVNDDHYVNQLILISRAFNSIDTCNKSVLEVGCGFGRVLNHLEKDLGIVANGIDQSTTMLEEAVVNGISEDRLNNLNIRDLPKNAKRYDIIYTCEMLIHIHPNNLINVMRNIINKANCTVINIETSPVKAFYGDDCHRGFWKHDYEEAYAKLGHEVRILSQKGTKHSAYILDK